MSLTQAPINVNSAGFTAVIASQRCTKVTVQETGQAASTDYLVAAPLVGSGPKIVAAGREFAFTIQGSNNQLGAQWEAGQTVGWLKAATGSVNFDVVCE